MLVTLTTILKSRSRTVKPRNHGKNLVGLHQLGTDIGYRYHNQIRRYIKLAGDNCDSFLYLSTKVTVFEPLGTLNSVYFDDARKHIFTLRSRGTMGVNVKSVVNDLVLNFRIDDQGEVLSIKFSENNKILGIQRTHRSVDFLNFQANCPGGLQYSQECKNKSALLLGFVWCSNYEVLFVTNEQLELYQVTSPF
ncbi:hypothetical protein Smp_167950 [Schistosoma mansoni]|uniref:hypothetical protein n=1 Tax=Schistosoma mansoni TaxID=6183 RepID=UPI00022DCB27|nr:hypothetical protein Smp_167950 [Schistosoma mansoni]|eukprot:XP_018654174.1 hypothetical protein Smp_167950 [Schistosoma mansoni]